jgi:3-oxoacyl-[acyl-carrier protein] reductase
MSLQGSNCIVTGGSEGIGKAIAAALVARGARVAICARTASKVDAAVTELRRNGTTVTGTATDVADESSVRKFVNFVHAALGPVQVLVNNAGLGHFAPIERLKVEQFDETMAVNVRGIFLMTRAILPDMRKSRNGDIVNIASLAGRNGFTGGTAYTASKHAVLGFGKSLMLEVRKDNIRVISVCPGSVVTDFFDKAGQGPESIDRALTADDVAQTVVATLELENRALISELDIRPTNP